jgi:hypothetical protein
MDFRQTDTEANSVNILIVSVLDHKSQFVETETDSAQLRAQKVALREPLESHLAEHKITAINEEWSRAEMTIAHQVASRNEPAIPWHNIDMTDDERRAAGIFDAQRNRPGHADWSDMPPSWIRDRIPSDEVREGFFVNRILEANASDGKVLVLLGNMHATQVAEKLCQMGHIIEIQP